MNSGRLRRARGLAIAAVIMVAVGVAIWGLVDRAPQRADGQVDRDPIPSTPIAIPLPLRAFESAGEELGERQREIERDLTALREACRGHEQSASPIRELMPWVESVAAQLGAMRGELVYASAQARREFHEAFLAAAAPLGEQDPVLHVSLLLAEAALLDGETARCLDLSAVVLFSQFGREKEAVHPHYFSPERWMYRVTAAARAADAAALDGDFRRALKALALGRSQLEGDRPDALGEAERALSAVDLRLSESDVFRMLGRMEDASAAVFEAGRELRAVDAISAGDRSVARLEDRLQLSKIALLLRRGSFVRAASAADALMDSVRARNGSGGELATALLQKGVAELGSVRRGLLDPSVPAATLGALIETEDAYRDNRRQALWKLLDLSIVARDWDAAARCLDLVERSNARNDDLRAGELAALRSLVERKGGREAQPTELWGHLEAIASAWGEAHGGEPMRGGMGFLADGSRRLVLSQWIEGHVGGRGPAGNDSALIEALSGLLCLEAVTTLARVRTGEAVGVDDVLRTVAAGARTVLVYLPSRFRSHLFELGGGEVRYWPLDAELALVDGLPEFAAQLDSPPARLADQVPALLEFGAVVRDRLIPDAALARVLASKQLVIVGAEYLQQLSFEALPVGDDLLGERVAVSYLDSLTLGVGLHRQSAVGSLPRRGALLACTETDVADPGFASTTFDRAWAEPILRIHAGAETRLEVDNRATTQRVLEALGSAQFGMVHVVAHGMRRWDSEYCNGIALHDGALWPDGLFGCRAQGLVVLSSCSAAGGESRLGDSALLTNLGGALLWEGASAVVLPRAPIPIAPHLRMMGEFHRAIWDEQKPPATALMQARARAASDGGWEHRFNRASVQLHGLGYLPLQWRR